MRRSKKKDARVPPDTYRVIKISGDAVFEFLHESMKDKLEPFFDVSDATSIVTSFIVDWDDGSLMMVARNEDDDDHERLQFPEKMDIGQLIKKLPDTVIGMYSGEKRYVDMTLNDIIEAQK